MTEINDSDVESVVTTIIEKIGVESLVKAAVDEAVKAAVANNMREIADNVPIPTFDNFEASQARDFARGLRARADKLDGRKADKKRRKRVQRANGPESLSSCANNCQCLCHDIGFTGEHGDLPFCPGKLVDLDERARIEAANKH